MKKAFVLSVLVIILAGCGTQYRIFDTGKESAVSGKILPDELNTLTAQQFAAYPILEDSDFLTLADFEQKWQLEDFHLSRKADRQAEQSFFIPTLPQPPEKVRWEYSSVLPMITPLLSIR